ncbi:hypothetical protein I3J27_38745 [Bradyrhizobium xenonodulans]|uniref:Uncharacterized protein n=1 Tax=Bradyrhizobium xenonodulans TaxID=2736875 RepID=A0ABY7MK71_9BRAD|nr:hypothetical protein [Bradyrhizobium xenonodulans]WBL78803.1 hypothetical protein I3J27_38745 [Bradyrhizobium xenonodulans]
MIGRGLESRIIKLEVRTARPHEMLVVWRRPEADVAGVLTGATFAPGDKVVCAEWFEDGPLPEPRWYGERLGQAMPAAEYEQLNRSIDRIAGRPAGKAASIGPAPSFTEERMRQMSDVELIHAVLGVQT